MKGPLLLIDWGIGGLSVYREVKARWPQVACVYVSDSGSRPYGRMSANELESRLRHLILAAREHWSVQRAIIACNAASTVLADLARAPSLSGFPISGVIEPGLALLRECGATRVAVIGGDRTVASGIFSARLRPLGLEVLARSAQPLSALIERGELEGPALDACLEEVVAPLRGVSALLLACTHYPAVAGAIAKKMPGTKLLDPARRAAEELAEEISSLDQGADLFLTTGDLAQTQRAARLAFGVEWKPAPLPASMGAP